MDSGKLRVSIEADLLVEVMLNILNREGYINNATYVAAKRKMEKESSNNVNFEEI